MASTNCSVKFNAVLRGFNFLCPGDMSTFIGIPLYGFNVIQYLSEESKGTPLKGLLGKHRKISSHSFIRKSIVGILANESFTWISLLHSDASHTVQIVTQGREIGFPSASLEFSN